MFMQSPPALADVALPAARRIGLLDYGRLFAALSVLSFHLFYNGIRTGKMQGGEYSGAWTDVAMYGRLGVGFFFMISGYVILSSAQRTGASGFAVARCV